MTDFYEEKTVGGVTFYRITPNGLWHMKDAWPSDSFKETQKQDEQK